MSLIIAGPDTVIPAPTQRGLSTAYCQRQTGRWSPVNGWTFDQEFRGLSLPVMQNLANLYGNAGIEYELTYQNGIATLRTQDTTGNVTIDVWEINANQMTVSWLKNPLLNAHLTTIAEAWKSTTDQNVIDDAVAFMVSVLQSGIDQNWPATTQPYTVTLPPNTGITEGVFAPTRFFGKTGFNWSSISSSDYWPLQRAYLRALAGQDAFYSDQYTLRHTTNASNRGYYNVADSNVNAIYTQAQFFSEITNGNYWIFPAPNEIIGALNSIFTGLGTAPANYLKGALKGGSSRVTAANNRVNIVTEYKLFYWSTDDYPLAT
jgi:hypothetical protein